MKRANDVHCIVCFEVEDGKHCTPGLIVTDRDWFFGGGSVAIARAPLTSAMQCLTDIVAHSGNGNNVARQTDCHTRYMASVGTTRKLAI